MKYHVFVDIKLPLQKTVALFSDLENRKQWMNGLVEAEHLSGIPNQKGAMTRLVFQDGKRRTELIETITYVNLPEEISGSFDAGDIFYRITNRFEAIDKQLTRYHTYNHYEFQGKSRWIAILLPNTFKKQTLEQMISFKNWAEGEEREMLKASTF